MRLFLLLVYSIVLLSTEEIAESATINFYVITALLIYNIITEKKISTISFFIFGFIYIFYREFLNNISGLQVDWGYDNVYNGYLVANFSFVIVVSSYFLAESRMPEIKSNTFTPVTKIIKKKTFFRLNCFLVLLIFSGNIVLVVKSFTDGRQNSLEYGIFSFISYALILVVIGNFKLYYLQFEKKINYLRIFIVTFPLFLLLFSTGTRFLLLFGIVALFSEEFKKINLKKTFSLLLIVIVLGFVSNIMLQFRNVGFTNIENTVSNEKEMSDSFTKEIVKNFTNEWVLRNASMISKYSSTEGYTNGSSSSFILVFWVPRQLWPDKPMQLDYWLIRKYYSEFDESGYSTASGFYGEFYMDFGMWGCFICMAILGWILCKINFKISNGRKQTYFYFILNGVVLAWTFFLVRSFLTSSYIIIFVIILTIILKKILVKWNIIK